MVIKDSILSHLNYKSPPKQPNRFCVHNFRKFKWVKNINVFSCKLKFEDLSTIGVPKIYKALSQHWLIYYVLILEHFLG